MTWTYVPDFTTTRDQIRQLVGDVDGSDQQVADEEIAAYVPGGVPFGQATIWHAAAAVADSIAGRTARQVDMYAGELRASLSQRMAQYRLLAADLRQRGAVLGGVVPYAGGISLGDKEAQEEDVDRTAPAFTTTEGDDEGGGSGSEGAGVGSWVWPA